SSSSTTRILELTAGIPSIDHRAVKRPCALPHGFVNGNEARERYEHPSERALAPRCRRVVGHPKPDQPNKEREHHDAGGDERARCDASANGLANDDQRR